MTSNAPSPRPKKEKAGFWCPEDVDRALKDLVARKVYDDRSKAIVALLRAALQRDGRLPSDLQSRLDELAAYLQRSPEAVVVLCIEGILELIHATEPVVPLIVEEVGLRRIRRLL